MRLSISERAQIHLRATGILSLASLPALGTPFPSQADQPVWKDEGGPAATWRAWPEARGPRPEFGQLPSCTLTAACIIPSSRAW